MYSMSWLCALALVGLPPEAKVDGKRQAVITVQCNYAKYYSGWQPDTRSVERYLNVALVDRIVRDLRSRDLNFELGCPNLGIDDAEVIAPAGGSLVTVTFVVRIHSGAGCEGFLQYLGVLKQVARHRVTTWLEACELEWLSRESGPRLFVTNAGITRKVSGVHVASVAYKILDCGDLRPLKSRTGSKAKVPEKIMQNQKGTPSRVDRIDLSANHSQKEPSATCEWRHLAIANGLRVDEFTIGRLKITYQRSDGTQCIVRSHEFPFTFKDETGNGR